jgi:hypothetical protein
MRVFNSRVLHCNSAGANFESQTISIRCLLASPKHHTAVDMNLAAATLDIEAPCPQDANADLGFSALAQLHSKVTTVHSNTTLN